MSKKYNKMETAPKDGTVILVWNVDRNELYDQSSWMRVAWLEDSVNYPNGYIGWRWCVHESWQDEQGGYDTANNPICWTPLPSPLTEDEEIYYK